MRAVSTALLAVAVIAASTTAASLDEPVMLTTTATTTPVEPQVAAISSLPNATSNSTSDRKIGVQARWCKGMLNANWDDYKHACVWRHGLLNNYYNQFFMKWNGDVVQQCNCDNALRQYDPWGPAWTYYKGDGVECRTRDGRTDGGLPHVFDEYGCS